MSRHDGNGADCKRFARRLRIATGILFFARPPWGLSLAYRPSRDLSLAFVGTQMRAE